MEPVYVATNPHEKAMQRALIQYRNPKNYDLVYEALMKADRKDLIGFDEKCLIKPRKFRSDANSPHGKNNQNHSGKGNTIKGKGNTLKGKGSERKKKAIRNVHKKKAK